MKIGFNIENLPISIGFLTFGILCLIIRKKFKNK